MSGDTPKNPFGNDPWNDGTPGNSNYLYVRSNGWLVSGWFGALSEPSSRIEFDPATGALAPTGTKGASQTGALQGLLWAITRGDAKVVSTVSAASYAGIAATP